MKKYYDLLGLNEGASQDEIKRAYRKMAMRYHPDLNPGADNREKFIEVLEAYEYLTGLRKMNKGRGLSAEDMQKFYDLMHKVAEQKAREKYKERVRQFRAAKEREQAREYQRGIFTFIGIIILSVAIWQGYGFYKNLMINRDPVAVPGKVTGIGDKRMIYIFPVGDSSLSSKTYVSNYGLEMLADNGMPLAVGDQFEVIFSLSDPSYHRVNFEKVSRSTINRYMKLVTARLQVIYAEEWSSLSHDERSIRARCMAALIFQKLGFSGLSTVYYYDASMLENFSHNSLRWYFMEQSEDFQKIKKSCNPT